ncbi:MAG: hypothetical protein QOH21_2007 [Acidobacteriota bacterium]|jgi:cyclopropane fatty-acyl-phospholipid synthase-like methyltransferase|nr:hypothetical protein [Acidobacteriota bacterium]
MKTRKDDAARWEALARREAYFPVLSRDGDPAVESSGVASQAFFQTGEEDVAALLGALATLFSRDVRLGSVLDFGCGAGRLTLPFARRAGRVVGCDIAPTVLAHARQNAERAGLRNVTFQAVDDVVASGEARFDFICSLLVFQYIPPAEGYALLQRLAALLNVGGVAALQLRFRGAIDVRRYARFLRSSGAARGERPITQVYRYDERLVVEAVESGGASVVARLASGTAAEGAVLVITR